ncbi:sterol 4-C-methyltransferase strm-1-like [Anomaloglossus baeobatrachus]|uniref:sterol 4-C-methyltransferase strm-1-like n=1 Tax=Anomaloglossus baeobatrachus TaxID=238106 RepID=UPI003F507EA3
MAIRLFKKTAFSFTYQKYMIQVSDEITNMVLSYVKMRANGRTLEKAVDVGCGTGRYTLPLAPHFKKVLGLDISDSQISVAKQMSIAKNVSYMVAEAENLPLKDASVDLVHAGVATHWFTIDKFLKEAVRVLKMGGCFATHAFELSSEIEYKNLSDDLNEVMSKVWDTLIQQVDIPADKAFSRYQNVFEAIPLKDKEHITDIPSKIQLSVPEMVGFIQSIVMFQQLKEKDVTRAERLLTHTEKRFREILGEEADSARMNVHMKHFCVLACKH